jgi:hypothetical protein
VHSSHQLPVNSLQQTLHCEAQLLIDDFAHGSFQLLANVTTSSPNVSKRLVQASEFLPHVTVSCFVLQ